MFAGWNRLRTRLFGKAVSLDAIWAIGGVILGAALVTIINALRSRREREVAQALLSEAQSQRTDDLNAVVEQLRTTFAALSRDALSQNTDDFLKLAKTRLEQQASAGGEVLETKKKLIDASLTTMNAKLGELQALTQTIDKERRETAGVIKTELTRATEATAKLRETTAQLREALASSQRRGQWGERMAEDVLRLAGFVEGVNYHKQATVESGERPDFTFMMPRDLRLNMDVKFPLDNYLRSLEATDDASREQFTSAFLKDVRKQLREVTSRAYIDVAAGTLNCVLLFIPNEQVYSFIHEHDNKLLDDAVRNKVVLCSPLTLYAVLSVVRQSVDNFRLGRVSNEILELLGTFRKEWEKYCEVAEKAGSFLERALTEFQKLQTTRSRQLERQLERIDDLQGKQDLPLLSGESDELR